MLTVSFPDLEDLLAESGSTADAAEAHGALCGALCSQPSFRIDDWLGELLDDESSQADDCHSVLQTVFLETLQALGEGSMAFAPLLPDDDQPLAGRTSALAAWCEGFLYGIGTSQVNSIEQLPGEVGEIVRDLTEISRATAGPGEPTESDEQDYAELVEFVRVGVQLIYDELEPLRSAVLPGSQGMH